jgi:hypothetical protein
MTCRGAAVPAVGPPDILSGVCNSAGETPACPADKMSAPPLLHYSITGSGLHDLRKTARIETGAADESPVDVRLRH